ARYGITPRVHFKYQPRYLTVGNADSVRVCMDYYDINEHALIAQGDNIFFFNMQDIINYHMNKGALMTIVLKPVENVEGFGVAKLKGDNRIEYFVEKPKKEEAPSNLANTGIYVISPEIRKIFQSDDINKFISMGKMDFGKDIIPYLINKGYPVYGYMTNDIWFDIGTPDRYLDAMLVLLRTLDEDYLNAKRINKDVRLFVQGTSLDSIKRIKIIERMYNEGKIKVEGSVLIGRHGQIGEGLYVEDSAIDNFSIIGKNIRVVKSSLMDRVLIGDNVAIENSIIGRHVEIKSSESKPVRIINSIIGDDVIIEEGSEIVNSKIYPHKIINTFSRIYDSVIT
ncbi:MAG: NDP-sugar synthase, partial [Sulfolobus sp.]|nr:NDP-sugar synthase [Sulfolobus sp.]